MRAKRLILPPTDLTAGQPAPLGPKPPAPEILILLARNAHSGTESDGRHVLVQVEAPEAAVVAADVAVGVDAAVGIGAVAAGHGVAGVEACRLHLQDRGVGAPEVAGLSGEGVAVAALF